MKSLKPIRPVLLAVYLMAPYAPSNGADWPQWRGPNRDGQCPAPQWPVQLDAQKLQTLWRVELGPSYSGPIIGGDRVFTTETVAKKVEAVRAFDRHTGKELWRHEWPGALSVPFFARANGDWIRATPTLDGERLYVAGMRDVLVCLDVRTGREIWRKDFVADLKTPLPDFGFVSSPLVDGAAVFVQAGASLAKLDKHSGKLLWRSLPDEGGMWGSAFSSPIMAQLAGRRQIIAQTRTQLAGVDPGNGQVLWTQEVPAFRGMNILTPVVHEDVLFTSTYGGKTTGFQITPDGPGFRTTALWQHKAQGYMSTPVVIGGVAYTHLKSQRLMAIEIKTGRELWTSDKSFGKYLSLVAQGDRILALDERGILFLFRANPERLEELAQLRIATADTWAHLGVADQQLFIRELGALTVYRWQ